MNLEKLRISGGYGKTLDGMGNLLPFPGTPARGPVPALPPGTLFGDDFPEYAPPAPVAPAEARAAGYARILSEMDRAGMAGILLAHLWLPGPGRCACQTVPDRPRGQFYAWWADHVAVVFAEAGFTAGWKAGQ